MKPHEKFGEDPIPLCIARFVVTGLFCSNGRREMRVDGKRVVMCIIGQSRRWEIFSYSFDTELAAEVFASLVRQVGQSLTEEQRRIVSIFKAKDLVDAALREMGGDQ